MKNELLTRECEIRADSITTDTRVIRVSFSSEQPVVRRSAYGEPWVETLGHSTEEVNLSRLNTSAPVLYNHQRGENQNRIGVVERAWLENGKGYADLRISRRSEVDGIWQDIQDGILRNVSVAYQIEEKTLMTKRNNEPDLYRVTNWTPIEISLVDIPADHTVGVGRSLELPQEKPLKHEDTMLNDKSEEIIESRGAPPFSPSPAIDIESIRRETLAKEELRRSEVRNVFKPFQTIGARGIDELLIRCLDNTKMNEREAKDLLLNHLVNNAEPRGKEPSIQVGESEVEKFRKYAGEAIAFRAGLADNNTKPTELYGYSLLELARKSLEIKGISTTSLDKREIVARAFTHSSSDFPILLANNAHKSMLKGYGEVEEVFSQFTSTGNLSDFKIHTREDRCMRYKFFL